MNVVVLLIRTNFQLRQQPFRPLSDLTSNIIEEFNVEKEEPLSGYSDCLDSVEIQYSPPPPPKINQIHLVCFGGSLTCCEITYIAVSSTQFKFQNLRLHLS